MKTLLVLRHAKSSWKQPELADHDRPLNKRGKRSAPLMGALLDEQGIVPDLIVSSTARRALDTARSVAEAAGYEGDIEARRELYHAEPQDYLEALADVTDAFDRVMVVGHNPGMEMLVSHLAGHYERFPTAALAHLVLAIDAWHEAPGVTPAAARLEGLWRPRDLE
ncbi:MAG: histidine phosphatase family protein [Planctomycetota bacterium]|nr:histidine phosphatase family protein [Planctomycetota bacterium]